MFCRPSVETAVNRNRAEIVDDDVDDDDDDVEANG
jgi:hypothetical protein